MASYFGICQSTDGKPLVGGYRRVESGRFELEQDAGNWVQMVLDANKNAIGEVHTSVKPPEITSIDLRPNEVRS